MKILLTTISTLIVMVILTGIVTVVGLNRYYSIKRVENDSIIGWVNRDGTRIIQDKKGNKLVYSQADDEFELMLSAQEKVMVVQGAAKMFLTETTHADGRAVRYVDGSSALLNAGGSVTRYLTPQKKMLFDIGILNAHSWDDLNKPFWKIGLLSPEVAHDKGEEL